MVPREMGPIGPPGVPGELPPGITAGAGGVTRAVIPGTPTATTFRGPLDTPSYTVWPIVGPAVGGPVGSC